MTNYILIDAKTRAPVPLPCYTDMGAVHAYHHEQGCYINQGERSCWVQPDEVGLALITEEQFMAEREVRDLTSIISLREDDD